MASHCPRPFFTRHGGPFPHPIGGHSKFPYQLGAEAASGPFIQQNDPMSAHETSLFRIAVLEEELAQAVSEKVAAEHAAHYILRASAQWQGLHLHTEHAKENPRLEGEIRNLTTAVADLRKRLHDLSILLENASRSQTSRQGVEVGKKLSLCPSSTQNRNGFLQPIDSPLLLLDLDEDEALGSCRPPTSEEGHDELDELALFCQLPPKIDFGSGEKEVAQAVASDQHGVWPQNESTIIRRFHPNAIESSTLSEIVGQPSVAVQVLLIKAFLRCSSGSLTGCSLP